MLSMSTTLKVINERGSKISFNNVAEIKEVLTVNRSSTENHLYHECCIRKTVIYFRKRLKPTFTFTGQRTRAACPATSMPGIVLIAGSRLSVTSQALNCVALPSCSTSYPLCLSFSDQCRTSQSSAFRGMSNKGLNSAAPMTIHLV